MENIFKKFSFYFAKIASKTINLKISKKKNWNKKYIYEISKFIRVLTKKANGKLSEVEKSCANFPRKINYCTEWMKYNKLKPPLQVFLKILKA